VRLFAGDHFPRLAIQSGDLLRPWVMPLGLPRAHRDRLAALLAQALRALEPGIALVQLRWAERHSLRSGRITLPSSVLVWWRIDAIPVVDPQAVILDGSKRTPGLTLYDFDQEVSLPAEAWLGPLKMGVLHRILDRLLDDRPVATHEEIADAVREISAKLISPIDLVEAAEAMVEVEAQGEGLDAAKAEAVGRVLAGRLATGPADAAVRGLVAVGRGTELGAEEREALRKAGLADAAGLQPVLDLLRDEKVLRRTLLRLAAQRQLDASIAELAPGLFPEERVLSAQPGVEMLPLQAPSEKVDVDEGALSLPEPHSPVVRHALDLIQRGDAEAGSRLLLLALQRREDRSWTGEDLRTAGLLLLRVATHEEEKRGQSMDASVLERIAVLCEAASDLLERGGAATRAVMALHGAGFARTLLSRWSDAAVLFERGRSLSAASGDRAGLALCLIGLADVKLRMGRAEEAIENAEGAAMLFRLLKNRRDEAVALKYVGDARLQRHDFEGARAAYERATTLVDDANAPIDKAVILLAQGVLRRLEGDVENARQALEEALLLFRDHKNRPLEASAHEELGDLSLHRGEPLRAREAYEEAAAIYHEHGQRQNEARVLDRLGDVRASMNDLAPAREAYDAALLLVREIGNRAWEASLLVKSAVVQHQSGDRDGAARAYEDALERYEEIGDRAAQAQTMMSLGTLQWGPERWDKGVRWFERAVGLLWELGAHADLRDAIKILYLTLLGADRKVEATQLVTEAIDRASIAGDSELATDIRKLLEGTEEDERMLVS
jgi:tetratricopeptide (TPR) repeat protein